jgi:hypothetical protein
MEVFVSSWASEAVLGGTDSGQVIVLCPTLEDELRPAPGWKWWTDLYKNGREHGRFGAFNRKIIYIWKNMYKDGEGKC